MAGNPLRGNDLDSRDTGRDCCRAGSGAVYLMTNQTANSIIVYDRSSNGRLTMRGTFATGGAGGQSPSGNPLDPLASQGSLLLSSDNRLLFAVNAGSDSISVMEVGQGGLTQLDLVSSGGTTPVSLTQYRDLLYVLNAGGAANIAGFRITGQGKLLPIPGSTRPVAGGAAAAPAQVGFSPDGDLIFVTEKNTNVVDTYRVPHNGVAVGPVSHQSAGLTPFGFAFARHNILVVSEAFGGAPAQAAASSYAAAEDGDLDALSSSVGDHQTAACWVTVGSRGKYAYLTNTGSGIVTGYSVSGNGRLRLLDADGVTARTGDLTNPIDMAATEDFLYVHLNGPNGRAIAAYRIAPNGGLALVDKTPGLPEGAQGIAAR
jgi:6-phosphogluconolactonase (cycloisomerase 2 family)